MKMKEKDRAQMAKQIMDLTFRTYYTFRDETREMGDVTVGSHAFGVLTKIYYSDRCYCVNELSEMMHMHNPQLSKLLNLLENEGFIERNRPKDNRRSVLISITDEGKAYFEKMYGIMEAKLAEVLADKDVDDPSGTAKAMSRLYSSLYLD